MLVGRWRLSPSSSGQCKQSNSTCSCTCRPIPLTVGQCGRVHVWRVLLAGAHILWVVPLQQVLQLSHKGAGVIPAPPGTRQCWLQHSQQTPTGLHHGVDGATYTCFLSSSTGWHPGCGRSCVCSAALGKAREVHHHPTPLTPTCHSRRPPAARCPSTPGGSPPARWWAPAGGVHA